MQMAACRQGFLCEQSANERLKKLSQKEYYLCINTWSCIRREVLTGQWVGGGQAAGGG